MTMPRNAPTRVIASFPDYAQAQHAVDALADRRLPVERLAIVGAGLQSYEQITGRKGYWRAALQGFASGAVVGALLGWILGLLTLIEPLVSAILLGLWGLLIGAVIGAVIGLIAHALSGGRRDFSSVSTVRAERYDVLAEADVAVEMERAIAEAGPLEAPRRG